jgi:hypothetical protein
MGWSDRAPDSRSLMRVVAMAATAILLLGCKPETETTGSTTETMSLNACAAKFYSSYDPKKFDQCVDVCIRCENGVTTTCATSCTLKGAR